jgi:hypothetical protein
MSLRFNVNTETRKVTYMKTNILKLSACLIAGMLLVNTSQAQFAGIVNIPDANMKAALVAHDPRIDTNFNTEIQCTEAEAFIERLNLCDKGITDATGLEAFVNITSLSITGNTQLSSIDVTKNTALQSLNCEYNLLNNIGVV